MKIDLIDNKIYFDNNIVKNKLFVYEGGCYDGCFWEPNAFIINKNGDFVDVYSSGNYGLSSFRDMIIRLERDKDFDEESRDHKTEVESGDIYINNNMRIAVFFDISESRDNSVLSEYGIDFMCKCCDAIEQEYNIIFALIKCPKCGDMVSYRELLFFRFMQEGGLVVRAQEFGCSECYDYCNSCEQVYDNDEMSFVNSKLEGCDYKLCDDCKKELEFQNKIFEIDIDVKRNIFTSLFIPYDSYFITVKDKAVKVSYEKQQCDFYVDVENNSLSPKKLMSKYLYSLDIIYGNGKVYSRKLNGVNYETIENGFLEGISFLSKSFTNEQLTQCIERHIKED